MLNNLLFLLIDFALFGGLILLVGCLALRFFQQPVERLRIIEWTLAGCLLAPLLQQIPGVPRWSLGLWPREETQIADQLGTIAPPAPSESTIPNGDFHPLPPRDVLPSPNLQALPQVSTEPQQSAPATTSCKWSWPLAIVIGFAAGSCCMAAWLAVGLISLWQIARRSRPALERVHELFRTISHSVVARSPNSVVARSPNSVVARSPDRATPPTEDLPHRVWSLLRRPSVARQCGVGRPAHNELAAHNQRTIRLAVTDRLALPIAFGLLRPTILLPAQLAQTATDAELRFCLAHEYSHVRNGDIRRWRFCTLIGLAFFYQPLYWIIRRQLRLAQDYLADNHAAQTAEPTDYASFLVSLAHHRLGLATSAGLSIGDGKSNLFRRVTALLEGRPVLLRSRRAWNLTTIIVALLLIGSISTIRIHANDEESPVASDGTKLDSYGDAIPKGALVRMGTVRLRHTSSVNGVAFSPDGKMIVSCGWDHPVRLWDAETGKPIRQLLGTVDCGSFGAAFSPDGNRLATVGERGFVRLWNPRTATELWKQKAGSDRIYGVAFSPDGKRFASAGDDGFVRVWDAATGKEVSTLNPQQKPRDAHGVAFSPDGKLLASGAEQGIKIFNLETGVEQAIPNAHRGEVTSLAFTADGKSIASGGRSAYQNKRDERGERIAYSYSEAKLWNVGDGKLVREFSKPEAGNDGSCAAVALSRDGSLLAEVTTNTIRIWNVGTGELVRTFSDYYNSFGPRTHAIAISPDNKTVATIGPHHVVMLWNVESGKRKLPFADAHLERIEGIDCSSKELLVASGGIDGDVRLWNLETGKHLRLLQIGELEPRGVHAVKFSPDGNYLAAGGYDWKKRGNSGMVSVWKVSDGKLLWSTVLSGRVTSLDYSRDGKLIAAGVGLGSAEDPFSNERKSCVVDFLDAHSGEVKSQWKESAHKACAVKFLPESKEVVFVQAGKAVIRWNLDDPEASREFNADAHTQQIHHAAFSGSGNTLATSGMFENLIVVWDANTGTGTRQIEIEGGKGSILAISPDGKLLAAGSIGLTLTDGKYRRSIQWWNLDTGARLGKFETSELATTSLTFSPDGRKLISGMDDGTLLVWNMPPFLAQAAPTEKTNPERNAAKSNSKADNPALPLTYQCIVQDKKTGKPIEGVKVTAQRLIVDGNKTIDTAQFTTGADGRYTLTFSSEQATDKQLHLYLRFEHPEYLGKFNSGRIRSSIEQSKTAGNRAFFEKTELEPGVPVTGRVVTPAGKPAANVRIIVHSAAGKLKLGSYDPESIGSTRTDAQGRFRFGARSTGETEFWILPDKDYALLHFTLNDRRGDIGTYRLQPGATIRGRVVDADGKPCANIAVSVEHTKELNGKAWLTPSSPYMYRGALTDANGEFKFAPLHAGWYMVKFPPNVSAIRGDDNGYLVGAPLSGVYVSQWVKFTDGEQPEPIEIRPVPTITLAGQIVDSKGTATKGKGNTHFSVNGRILPAEQLFHGEGAIDSEGKITAKIPRGLAHTELGIGRKSQFRWRKSAGEPLSNVRPIDLGAVNDDLKDLEVVQYLSPVLLVKTVSKDGAMIKDAKLRATYAEGRSTWTERFRRPDGYSDVHFKAQADSQHRSDSILPDEETTLIASAEGFQDATAKVNLKEGEQKEITLTLGPAANGTQAQPTKNNAANKAEPITYTGIVQDKQTGKPIAGAAVRVRVMKDYRASSKDTEESNHTTDANGEYSFTVPAEMAGEDDVYTQFRIEHASYATSNESFFLELARKRGQPSPRRLSKPMGLWPGQPVTGVVATPDGKPAAGIIVRAFSDFPRGADRHPLQLGNYDYVQTDAEGRFRLMMLSPGAGVFWILPNKDFAPSRHMIGEKRGDMGTFTLQRGQSISGKLVDTSGKPVAGVYVSAEPSNRFFQDGFSHQIMDQISRWATTDASGGFKMAPLAPGKYRLQTSDEFRDLSADRDVWPERHVSPAVFLPKSITIVEGESLAPVELRAVPDVLIQAQAIDSQGKPRSGFAPDIGGKLDNNFFVPMAEVTPQGKITARAPRGLTDVRMFVHTDQNNSFRWRLGKDRPWNTGREINLGAVGDGIAGIEIMYYDAPVLTVKVVTKDDTTPKDADVTAFYAKGVLPQHGYSQKRIWPTDVVFDEQSTGQFRSICLLPDEEITVTAYTDGLKSPMQKVKLGEGEQKEITLVLDKSAPGEVPKSPVIGKGAVFKVAVEAEDETEKPKAQVGPMPKGKGGPKSDNGNSKSGKDDNAKADKPERWDVHVDIVVQSKTGVRLADGLPSDLGQRIKQLDNVKDICGGSVDLISFPKESLISVPVNGWPLNSSLWKRLVIKSGRSLQSGDDRHALLGHELADKLKKRAGDTVVMYAHQFEVVGIYESLIKLENEAVVMLLDQFQQLTASGNTVTGFTVELKDRSKPGELERVCKQIEELLPGKIQAKPVSEIFRGDIKPPKLPQR